MVVSNKSWFKYNWVLKKGYNGNGMLAKYQPMNPIESISVFYKKAGQYFPQMEEGKPYSRVRNEAHKNEITGKEIYDSGAHINETKRYPIRLLDKKEFSCYNHNRLHVSQKAVPLLEYLIKTYTTEGMTVLDNTMGSGSTGVAAKNLNRNFIRH